MSRLTFLSRGESRITLIPSVIVIAGVLFVGGCAAEPAYMTKPGEWDPATLAKDEAECEALATDSASYRRTFNNPFTTMFARGVLLDQTRDCLIRVHGWQETKTVQAPMNSAPR